MTCNSSTSKQFLLLLPGRSALKGRCASNVGREFSPLFPGGLCGEEHFKTLAGGCKDFFLSVQFSLAFE
jgi:hypothetical protein